jgi:hypothetical protein
MDSSNHRTDNAQIRRGPAELGALALGAALGCSAPDPAPSDHEPLVSCSHNPHLVELYHFDERVPNGAERGCEEAQGDAGFAAACTARGLPVDCSDPHYDIEPEKLYVQGCSIDVSDHTHTLHIAEHMCAAERSACTNKGDAGIGNCNTYHPPGSAECRSGGCFYLDCYMDALKVQEDIGQQLHSGRDVSLDFDDQASFLAWVRMDTERRSYRFAGDACQSVIGAADLSFGVRVIEEEGHAPSLRICLEATGAAPITSAAGQPLDGGYTLVGLSLHRDGDQASIRFYMDGEEIEGAARQVPWDPASPTFAGFETEFRSMGGGYCGWLDDVMIFDRAVSPEQMRMIHAAYQHPERGDVVFHRSSPPR